MNPLSVTAKPVLLSVKKRSVAWSSAGADAPAALVPGTGPTSVKVKPSSARCTVPSPSSRKALWGDGSEMATVPRQCEGTTFLKVRPASSERPVKQLPPNITPEPAMAMSHSCEYRLPLRTEVQLRPPSCVRSSAPKSPAAIPNDPWNSIARSVSPCGCGLPQNQPEWPTPTGAALAVEGASSASASTRTSLFIRGAFALTAFSPAITRRNTREARGVADYLMT